MNALWIDILSLAYSACRSFTHPYPRKCQWMPTGFSATKTDKNQEIISIVAFCRLNMVQHTLVHIRAAHCCWLHAYVTAGWAFTSRQDSKETKWHEIEWKHKPGIHFWNLDNRTSLSLHHVWVRWALAMEKILFSSVGVGRFLRLQLKMHQLTCTKLYQSRVGPVESNTCVPSPEIEDAARSALWDASAPGVIHLTHTPHTHTECARTLVDLSRDFFPGINITTGRIGMRHDCVWRDSRYVAMKRTDLATWDHTCC